MCGQTQARWAGRVDAHLPRAQRQAGAGVLCGVGPAHLHVCSRLPPHAYVTDAHDTTLSVT